MTVTAQQERRLSMSEIATRYGVHLTTAHRWRLHGVAGVRLRTFRIGGKRFAFEWDVEDFHRQVTAATDSDTEGDDAE